MGTIPSGLTVTGVHPWFVDGVLSMFETVAQFWTLPAVDAPAVISMVLLSPGLKGVMVLQVTVWPLVMHCQPEPLPEGLVKAVGTASVIVVILPQATPPVFVTVMVKVTVWKTCTGFGAAVLLIIRSHVPCGGWL
jgi:hypothetical protein